jgi:hypothetical protein
MPRTKGAKDRKPRAKRKLSGLETSTIRISAKPNDMATIKAWLNRDGVSGSRAAAKVLLKATRRDSAKAKATP